MSEAAVKVISLNIIIQILGITVPHPHSHPCAPTAQSSPLNHLHPFKSSPELDFLGGGQGLNQQEIKPQCL